MRERGWIDSYLIFPYSFCRFLREKGLLEEEEGERVA